MYEYGVIGLGPAGCLFLACLQDDDLGRMVVFDSGCVGGDLARLYGNVVANLTCAKLSEALRTVPRWSSARLEVFEGYAPDACPRLADLCIQLRELMKPVLARVTLHSKHVTKVRREPAWWCIETDTSISGSIQVAKVIVCTGGEARRLNYPKPAIPLEIALNKDALTSYIRPIDRVVVFGTAHSGTLILRNLRDVGCRGMVGVYRGGAGASPPFRWATPHTPECPCHLLGGTGCHDSEGLKQESAAIAAAIVRGEWASDGLLLVRLEDTEAVVRAVMAADYVVYSVGFQARVPHMEGLGGEALDAGSYDPVTGAIAPGAWGFGLAFPSMYEKPQGGIAPDVGLPGFVGHILHCMPAILAG